MKKLFLLSVLAVLYSVVMVAQEYVPQTNNIAELSKTGKQEVSWETMDMKLNTIEYRVPKEVRFTMTNTGELPVLITNVKASCGCTKVKYPKQPVQPGESVSLKVTYNAAKKGKFYKTVSVYIQGELNPHKLKITGEVK